MGHTLPKPLTELIADLTDARHDGFYRRLYKLDDKTPHIDVTTIKEWRDVPFLTKSDLVAIPLKDRIYCEMRGIAECIDTTSGTSGGPPLFVARTNMTGFEFRAHAHDFSRPIMCASQPTPQRVHHMVQDINPGGTSLVLDVQHIPASMALAKAAGSRSIIMPAHMAREVAECAASYGFAQNITSIELNGSSPSVGLVESLLEMLPSARITTTYGLTEVEASPAAFSEPTRDIDNVHTLFPNDDVFLEIIDPETLLPIEPTPGAEGEVVLTRYVSRPFAFPLVRYRTGDIAQIIECTEESRMRWSFSIRGRRELDFIKVPGGILRSDEIERALLQEFGNDFVRFEADCSENTARSGPEIGLLIHIQTRGDTPVSGHANMLAEKIHVSPSFTYADGVRKGMYEPLACKNLGEKSKTTKPHRLKKIAKSV